MQSPDPQIPISNLLPLAEWADAIHKTRATVWRWRKEFPWFRTTNVFGKLYVTRDTIAEFERRALAGEFAKSWPIGRKVEDQSKDSRWPGPPLSRKPRLPSQPPKDASDRELNSPQQTARRRSPPFNVSKFKKPARAIREDSEHPPGIAELGF